MRPTQSCSMRLAKQDFRGASQEVRAELLEFFGHPDAPYTIKRKPKDWAKVQGEVEQLRNTPPAVSRTAADSPSSLGVGSVQ